MRLDLVERLRCPRPHAPTPLVVVASRVVERDLVQGVAGCPLCRAELCIEDGDVWLGGRPTAHARAAGPRTPTNDAARRFRGDDAAVADAFDRLVALLGLADPGGAVLLAGAYARHALPLAAHAEYSVVTLGDDASAPPPGEGHRRGLAVAAVRGVPGAVPFTDATFRGAALGASLPSALVADAVRCVMAGGRVVGAAALPLPDGVRELARDDAEWVGERAAPTPIVTLGRRGG